MNHVKIWKIEHQGVSLKYKKQKEIFTSVWFLFPEVSLFVTSSYLENRKFIIYRIL